MWLVWYVATIGSLNALGLLPIFEPTQADEERTPDGDL
jgi:hypothetical protein